MNRISALVPLGAALALTVLAIGDATGVARAQDFPVRPITVIVPFPAGGISDQATRLAAQKVHESTGQPVIIDNRPGGGGQIGASAVKIAKPDGYTLFLANIGTHAINQSLYEKLTYDPVKDFEPVALMFSFPHVLAVPGDSKFTSVADLVAAAKAKPGSLRFASQGVGSGGHLLTEMFKSGNRLELVHIPYRGSAQALPDLLAGRVDFYFDGIPGAGSLVREGKLRGLALADGKRSSMLPDLPTMAEAGFPGYELTAWFGLAAPAKTPKPVIDKLHAEFVKALRSPEVTARLGEWGANVVASSPAEFAAVMASETERLGKVVRESGARVE